MQNIGVIGGGAWGTAIANLLSHNDNNVKLWVFEEKLQMRLILIISTRTFFHR